jgi:hypothetical protein
MKRLPQIARGGSACRRPTPTRSLSCVLMVCALGLAAPARAAPILTVTPNDGALYGKPGETVGWGFTLTNDDDYLVVTGVEFLPASLPIGTFVDYLSLKFIVVGPAPESETIFQVFDPDPDPEHTTGLGAFEIDPFATIGSIAAGSLTLTYDLYPVSPNDPNFDPDDYTPSFGNVLSAEVSVQVVPTPSPLLLLLPGLLGLLWRNRPDLPHASRPRQRQP